MRPCASTDGREAFRYSERRLSAGMIRGPPATDYQRRIDVNGREWRFSLAASVMHGATILQDHWWRILVP
jgi:hypothetical protein